MRTSLLMLRVFWTPENDMEMFKTPMPPRSSRITFPATDHFGERLLLTATHLQCPSWDASCLMPTTTYPTVFCIWHTSKTWRSNIRDLLRFVVPIGHPKNRGARDSERDIVLTNWAAVKRSNFYSCWFMTYPLVKITMENLKNYHQNDGFFSHGYVSLQECRWCLFVLPNY